MQRQLLIQSNYIFLVNLLKSHGRGAFWDTGYEGYGLRDTRDTKGQGYGIPNEFSGLRDTRVTGYRTTIFMVTGYGLRVTELEGYGIRDTKDTEGYGIRVTGYAKVARTRVTSSLRTI